MPRRDTLPAKSRTPTLGIDVSSNQGEIDWAAVKAARVRNPVSGALVPVSFAIIRGPTGSRNPDSKFADYWQAAGDLGIRRAPYLAMTVRAHELGADHYLEQLDRCLSLGYKVTDLPPQLDHERGNPETNPEPTPDAWRRNVATLREVQRGIASAWGRRCGIYAGGYWTSAPADVESALRDLPVWCPDYRSIRGYPWDCRVPVGWDKWYFRQFTNGQNGTVVPIPGVRTRVDVDLYDGGPIAFRLHVARSHLTPIKLAGALLALSMIVVFSALAMSGRPMILAVT